MPAYDAKGFQPPAPAALVTIYSAATGKLVRDVPMLLDSGADVSLIPSSAVASIVGTLAEAVRYELEAFDGTKSSAPAAQLELRLLGKSFKGKFLLIDASHGIIGRNILNSIALVLDGPALEWRENV